MYYLGLSFDWYLVETNIGNNYLETNIDAKSLGICMAAGGTAYKHIQYRVPLYSVHCIMYNVGTMYISERGWWIIICNFLG